MIYFCLLYKKYFKRYFFEHIKFDNIIKCFVYDYQTRFVAQNTISSLEDLGLTEVSLENNKFSNKASSRSKNS